jgi:hypothetical protein
VRYRFDAIRNPYVTRRCQNPGGSGLHDRFQARVHVLAEVKGTMKSNRKGAGQIYQLASAKDIDPGVLIENAQHNAIHPHILGHSNIAFHDVEFMAGIPEVSGSRANQNVNGEAQMMARSLDQSRAGSDSPAGQIAAKFNTMRATAFSRHGAVDRLQTNFKHSLN